MNLSIGAFGSNAYTGQKGAAPAVSFSQEQKAGLTPAEEIKRDEKEQERRELLGIKDPMEPKDSRKPKDSMEPRRPGEKKKPGEECQTCKNRKYQDGSDEMVSFKSAAHISPESAAARVRAHEQEHVSNAYTKAAKDNGKVISASVSIHTAICPECGRTYVSGGTTQTQIKYYNEDNPYQKGLKTADQAKYSGMNADYAV
ncbi:MAG: hypothetical protein NC517_08070 [Firmicutes bacterium]|nr:hypothetical protein [Bacillota bacterium]